MEPATLAPELAAPDALAPETIAQATPPQEPAGRARMKQLHTTLVKQKYDVPDNFAVFEEKLLEKPERLAQLHATLVKDKFEDVPQDLTTFEDKLTEGLKKKALPSPSQPLPAVDGNASGIGSATGSMGQPTTSTQPAAASDASAPVVAAAGVVPGPAATPAPRFAETVKQSPNIRTAADKRATTVNKPELFVLHHTAFDGPDAKSKVDGLFMQPGGVSSHVVIEKDGSRTVYATPGQIAFHAGKGSYNGRESVNDFSLGVEFQGDTGKAPLTQEQIDSFVEYARPIMDKYGIAPDALASHHQVAGDRKPDIADAELARVKAALAKDPAHAVDWAMLNQLPVAKAPELATENGRGALRLTDDAAGLTAHRAIKLHEPEEGMEAVRLPDELPANAEPPGTYTHPDSTEPTARYFDRPMSKVAEGETEDVGQAESNWRRFTNGLTKGVQGAFTAGGAVMDLLATDETPGAYTHGEPLTTPGLLTQAADKVEQAWMKPVAPYYQGQDFLKHPSWTNLGATASELGGIALPLIATAAVGGPEAQGAKAVLARIVGSAGTGLFDFQMVQSAHDAGKAAGLKGASLDAYTLFAGAAQVGTFKLGGKLVENAAQSLFLREVSNQLAVREATGALSKVEAEGLAQRAAAAVATKIEEMGKGALKNVPVFTAAEWANIVSEQVANKTMGAKFTDSDWSERTKHAMLSGAVIGAATKGMERAPKAEAAGKPDVPRETYPSEGPTFSVLAADGRPAIEGARVAGHFVSPSGIETLRLVTPEGVAHEVPADAAKLSETDTKAAEVDTNTPQTDEAVPETDNTATPAAADGTPTPWPKEKEAALARLEKARQRLVEAQAADKARPKPQLGTFLPLGTVDGDVVKGYLELAMAHINLGVVNVKALVAQLRQDQDQIGGLSASEPEREQQLQTLARHALAQEGHASDLPEFNPDKPAAHRAAGGFVKEGQVYERVAPLGPERLARGKKTNVVFSGRDKVPAHYAVMEADDLQPSHRNGTENPLHFIPEAQPKDRTADQKDSEAAIKQIADAPDVERLGQSPDAYSGTTVVNERGEAVQGNGRGEGVRRHYENAADGGEQFRAETAKLAADVGISADVVAKFKKPVVVRVLGVPDAEAVRLGNFDVKDLESGGQQRVDPKATVGRMDEATKARVSQILGEGTANISTLSGIVKARGAQLLQLLNRAKLLTPTQVKGLVDKQGNLNAEGIRAMRAMLREIVVGGNARVSTAYTRLPDAVRHGIDRALLHIAGGRGAADFRDELRTVLAAMRDRAAYVKATGGTHKDWLHTAELFGAKKQSPAERLSATERALLNLFDRNSKTHGTAKDVYEALRRFSEATQGRPGDFLNPEIPGVPKEDALGYLAKPKKGAPAPKTGATDAAGRSAELAQEVEAARAAIRAKREAMADERAQTGSTAKEYALPGEVLGDYVKLGVGLLQQKALTLRRFAEQLRTEHEALAPGLPLTDREVKRVYSTATAKLGHALGEKAKFTRARLTAEIKEVKDDLRKLGHSTIDREKARAAQRAAVDAAKQKGADRLDKEKQRAVDQKADLQARAKAYRDKVAAQRKHVADWLAGNRSRFSGHVKGKEMASILRRVNAATTTDAVTKALDYAEKVLADKEYASRLQTAEKARKVVQKMGTSDPSNRFVTVADRELAADFAKIDPETLSDADLAVYTNVAKRLAQGSKKPGVQKASRDELLRNYRADIEAGVPAGKTVDTMTRAEMVTAIEAADADTTANDWRMAPGRTLTTENIRRLVDAKLQVQEDARQTALMNEFATLTDAAGNPLLKAGTSADEMVALVNEAMRLSPDELQQAKDNAEALAVEKRAVLESAAAQFRDEAHATGSFAAVEKEHGRDVVDALVGAGITDLSDKALARYVGVLDNIRTNGNADGAGDVVAEVKAARVAEQLPREMAAAGITPGDISAILKGDVSKLSPRARKWVKEMEATKKIRGGLLKGTLSLDLLVEVLGRTVEQTARIKRALGIDGVSEGFAKANIAGQRLRKGFDTLLSSFGARGAETARLPLNIIRRGVLAHAVQHQGGGPAELRTQFAKVKAEVKLSYERLLASPSLEQQERGELVKQAYDELLDKASTGDEAVAAMQGLGRDGVNNLVVVDYFQKVFADKVDALDANLRLYHNQALDRFENYTSTSKVTLDKSGLAKAGEEGQESMMGSFFTAARVDTKQSGTTIARTGGLREGQVLDFDFDTVQERRFFEANYDVESGAARRLFNAAMQRPELQEALGGQANAGVLYGRVKGMVDAQRGIGAAGNEAVAEGMKVFNVLSREGARLALHGTTQLAKQYFSVAVNTLTMLGKNPVLYFKAAGMVHGQAEVLNAFLEKNGASITQRVETEAGLNRDVSHTGIKRMEPFRQETSRMQQAGHRAVDVVRTLRDLASKPLVYSDVTVAKTSWVAFYLESLQGAGADIAGVHATDLEQLGNKKQQELARSYAEQMVSRAQNINDKTKAAPLYQDLPGDAGSLAKIARNLLLPFSGFSVNQRGRMIIDARRVFEGGLLAPAPGKGRAWQSLGATVAETVVFNSIKVLVIKSLIQSGVGGLLTALGVAHKDDDKTLVDKAKEALALSVKDLAAAGFGGAAEEMAAKGINAAYAKAQDMPVGERPKTLVTTAFSDPNQVDLSGWGGVAPFAQKVYLMGQAVPYLDGQYDRLLNARSSETEKRELSEGETRAMRLAFLVDALSLIASDADVARAADKVQRTTMRGIKEKEGGTELVRRTTAGRDPRSAEAEAAASDNRDALRVQAENNVALARIAEKVVADKGNRATATTAAKKELATLAGGSKAELHRLRVALHNHIEAAKRYGDAPAYVREVAGLSTKRERGYYINHLVEGKSEAEKQDVMQELRKRHLLDPAVRAVLDQKP